MINSIRTSLSSGSWIKHPRAKLILRMWAGVAVPVLILVFSTYVQDGLTNGAGKVLGEDFVDFWVGSLFALSGQGALAYDLDAFRAIILEVARAPIEPYLYSYPPSLMLLTLPLALLPFGVALLVWTLGGGLAVYALLRRLLDKSTALFVMLGTPALFVNAVFGQTGALTAVFFGGGLLLLNTHPLTAGILLGLLSFKPHLGLLLPVALVFGGHWRAFMGASLSVITLFMASAAVIGVDAWMAFPERIADMQTIITLHGQGLWHRIPTTFISARLLGFEANLAWGFHIPVALIALITVARVWKSDVLPSSKAVVLVLATLLATPYAWDYDMVVLTVVVAWRFKDGDFRPWEASTLVLAMLLPFILAPLAKGLGVPIGPVVLLLALWISASDARCDHRQDADVPANRYSP